MLAYCYFFGLGVVADLVEAIRLYTLAAENGNMFAKYELAILRRDGIWIEEDWPKALRLFQESAGMGFSDAQVELGRIVKAG